MSGWDEYDAGSDSGPEREPSEERGRAAWSDGQTGATPPWAAAETQTGGTTPPPWASAETQTGGAFPPPWTTPPPGPVTPPGPAYTASPMPPGPAYTGAPTPPYTLPPVPPSEPRRRVGRVLAVIALVVAVGAGTGAGTWYLIRDHRSGTGAGPVTGSSVSVSASTSPAHSQGSEPPSSPADTATANPSASLLTSPAAGYRRAEDPVGYAIDVPQGWTRREKQGKLAPIVYYDSPADGRQLQIFRVTESTPYESLTVAETDPGFGFAKQPGYQVIQRDHGDTWAELTYRYTDQDKGARQVIDHRFEAADGTLYAIRASGPASLAPEQVREPLRTAVRYFCPTGAQCT
ncbi:hypothetical protein [Streptomyces gilvus]|uniref:hypothetical protein n=1 Tax=Streptomyces gilvus TaxID=2920937 RepID=UPI001F118700|nr:hypothetical protein [Streptomyces sp. CME 23]MCH5673706.1 hypothetical protein [Streptomyces sp. CME 23]